MFSQETLIHFIFILYSLMPYCLQVATSLVAYSTSLMQANDASLLFQLPKCDWEMPRTCQHRCRKQHKLWHWSIFVVFNCFRRMSWPWSWELQYLGVRPKTSWSHPGQNFQRPSLGLSALHLRSYLSLGLKVSCTSLDITDARLLSSALTVNVWDKMERGSMWKQTRPGE